MGDVSQGASYFRISTMLIIEHDKQSDLDESPVDTAQINSMTSKIVTAINKGECPAGWPEYNPHQYNAQLEAKAQLVRDHFPESSVIGLEVMRSPKSHHRMRAKVGIAGNESSETLRFVGFEQGDIDVLSISSEGICAFMPIILEAVKNESELRQNLTMMSFLNTTNGISETGFPQNIIACLVYSQPLNNDLWKEACERQLLKWSIALGTKVCISLIGQARHQRIVVGQDFVHEEYSLKNGKKLRYKHVFGHFSNPNPYACAHTLDFLRDTVLTMSLECRSKDLLELYCGNGNHTVAIAPLFRKALAVEINPSLCKCAEENLANNGVSNAVIQKSPSVDFCTRVLRQKLWLHKPSGEQYEFDTVLVDPPRSGLDDLTRKLVAKYSNILYISCNPFVSFRRDLDELLAEGFSLSKIALIDHFPYTPHTELAICLRKN